MPASKRLFFYFALVVSLTIICCSKIDESFGYVERLDPALDAIISKDAKVSIIEEGFKWTEGPLWIEKENMLLFSDIPVNTIFKWTKEKGKEVYLTPSGYTSTIKRGGETGSNGLLLNNQQQLILCQHGDRRIALMDAPLAAPKAAYITLADQYNGKKFDSPNDAVINRNGDIYFTDPPYGLEKNVDDPNKAAPYQGVYKLSKDGKLTLLTDTITRPNGIAFLPGEKQLLIANSDGARPYWYIYDIIEDGLIANGKIFYDASNAAKISPGLPDGLKVDQQGNIFATGPGGVWIFNKDAKLIGKIHTDGVTSNCAIAEDKILYVTAERYLLQVPLRK